MLQRARLLRQLRAFFDERGVLEVETPLLADAPVTDPHIEAIATESPGGGDCPRYLQTSPEYAMKRLLAAGSGPIYQICKAFRHGERGARHNPEFTLLEWYRPDFDSAALIAEVADLMRLVLGERPVEVYTYGELFRRELGIDPHRADTDTLAEIARQRLASTLEEADRDTWLQLLMAMDIEPRLGRGVFTFVTDFPASQAALARVERDAEGRRVARRFELFIDGVELANGYHELGNAAEQRRRFNEDCNRRRVRGQRVPPVDEYLLAALEAGLPDCAGVALGVDRLLMLAMGARRIDEVLAFPLERV